MGKVNDENYINIMGWMVNKLHLKGNELLIYAIIYGFSQAEQQTFSGSLQYLADWTNSTRQGVMKNLKSLLDKGLIEKKDININGVKFCEYCTTELLGVYNKVYRGVQQSLTGGVQQSLTGGVQQSLHNNINIDNTNNNINNNISGKRFKPPTVDEVKAYCIERQNNVDAERFIDYYTANGWKVGKNTMKDWKAAVRTWERNGYSAKGKVGANGVRLADHKPDDDGLDGIF